VEATSSANGSYAGGQTQPHTALWPAHRPTRRWQTAAPRPTGGRKHRNRSARMRPANSARQRRRRASAQPSGSPHRPQPGPACATPAGQSRRRSWRRQGCRANQARQRAAPLCADHSMPIAASRPARNAPCTTTPGQIRKAVPTGRPLAK